MRSNTDPLVYPFPSFSFSLFFFFFFSSLESRVARSRALTRVHFFGRKSRSTDRKTLWSRRRQVEAGRRNERTSNSTRQKVTYRLRTTLIRGLEIEPSEKRIEPKKDVQLWQTCRTKENTQALSFVTRRHTE